MEFGCELIKVSYLKTLYTTICITGEFILQQLIINYIIQNKILNNDKQARHSVYVHEFDFIFKFIYNFKARAYQKSTSLFLRNLFYHHI